MLDACRHKFHIHIRERTSPWIMAKAPSASFRRETSPHPASGNSLFNIAGIGTAGRYRNFIIHTILSQLQDSAPWADNEGCLLLPIASSTCFCSVRTVPAPQQHVRESLADSRNSPLPPLPHGRSPPPHREVRPSHGLPFLSPKGTASSPTVKFTTGTHRFF